MPLTMTPLGATAALCHMLLVGLLFETRLMLHTAVQQPAPARRALLRDDDGAPADYWPRDEPTEACATAAEVEHLRATTRAQLEAQAGSIAELRERSLELAAALGSLSGRGGNADPRGEPPDEQKHERLASEMAEIRADCAQAKAERADTQKRVADLEMYANVTSDDGSGGPSARHRKQSGGAACDAGSWATRTTLVMDACCPATSGHRRAQDRTCPLPTTCPSASCAAAFVPYYEDCGAELQSHAAELPLAEFLSFYASCQEIQVGSQLMLQDAQPAMIFHVLVVGEGDAQAGAMFSGGGTTGGTNPPLDPLQPLVPPPPALPTPAPSPNGASTAQEFRRVCTRSNLAVCAPVCNEETYGFLLSIEIDGRGTVMT